MMLRAFVVTVASACARVEVPSDIDCPPEAIVEVVQFKTDLQRTCEWSDRRTTVTTDRSGAVIGRLGFRDGKFDGLQLSHHHDVRSEQWYRDGALHGWAREYRGEALVADCLWIDGLRDGVCWSEWGTMQFDHGRRVGIWRFGQGVRVYGADVLLGVDGRALPFPRDSINVDGAVIARDRCELGELGNPCHTLFEDFQICELKPERARCFDNARELYRSETAHLRRREAIRNASSSPLHVP